MAIALKYTDVTESRWIEFHSEMERQNNNSNKKEHTSISAIQSWRNVCGSYEFDSTLLRLKCVLCCTYRLIDLTLCKSYWVLRVLCAQIICFFVCFEFHFHFIQMIYTCKHTGTQTLFPTYFWVIV